MSTYSCCDELQEIVRRVALRAADSADADEAVPIPRALHIRAVALAFATLLGAAVIGVSVAWADSFAVGWRLAAARRRLAAAKAA